jgi:hypothetical protein
VASSDLDVTTDDSIRIPTHISPKGTVHIMKLKFTRVLAMTAAAAAVGGTLIIPAATAGASSAGTTPAGSLTVTPTTGGTLAGTFTATPPAGSVCPADTSAGGARWQTFIAPQSVDPVTLAFNASGPTAAGSYPLFDAVQNPQVNKSTAAASGLITPVPTFSLSALPAGTLPDGGYWLGIACTVGGQIIDFGATSLGVAANPALVGRSATWVAPITVSGAGFSYGAAPAAPVLTLGAGTGTTQTVNFTHAASVPATTGYTATVAPAPANAIPTINPGDTSFQLTGLTLGTPYTVSLVATNGQTSPVSNTLSFTASITAPAPTVTAPNVFAGNDVTVSWAAPATGPAPASYDVAITPGGPTFAAVAGLSQIVTGLAAGDYTATVTPNYAAGSGVSGVPGTRNFTVSVNTLVYQQITVTRPPGALVLTQRCGVYGPLDPFTAIDAFPGFPLSLGAEAGVVSTPGVNQAPDVDPGPGYTADPNFASYPQAGTYPTECGLDMGSASLVSTGSLSGQFYTASGRLNQVTVLDTRDIDSGWVARGDVTDTFVGSTGDSFSGDYLGWAPQVTSTSNPGGLSTYDQVVSPGGVVLPGTANGLTANPPLAFAAAGAGLGIATLDARMNLLIPASADAADYAATLSLTVA